MTTPPSEKLDPRIVKQAIAWHLRLQAGDDSELQRQCEHWRGRHASHERAWQRVCDMQRELGSEFDALPKGAADALETSARRLQRRRTLKLLCLGLLGTGATWTTRESLWQPLLARHRTGTGERRRLRLEDGTELHLNTDTALDLHFDAEQRLIHLYHGEILVVSGADPGAPSRRPLRVRTRHRRFQAIGTRFIVRLNEDATLLSVEQGAVAIDAIPPQRVETGQRYRVTQDEATLLAPPAMDPSAWSQGLIVTRDMRLADFIAEISRYRTGYLGCADSVADLRLSGVYRLEDTDQLLTLLARTLPVDIHYRTRWWVRVEPRG
ncbi:FecR domain-containing protein [Azomonas macrocytogenes]|nr:FecR domain-containing protein [Azomonas macrocytogenes]